MQSIGDKHRWPDSRGHGRGLLSAAALVLATSACERIEAVVEDVRPAPSTPREAYVASLADAGLDETALARRWAAAADEALSAPVRLQPPFEEIGFYPADEPTATGYLVDVDRGQAIHISYDAEPDEGPIFLDVFRSGEGGALTPVAHALENDRSFEFEADADGEFVVRIQPELLRDVRITLRVYKAGALAFPVEDHDAGDIQSRFGVERDGGRRSHHGVDIFAPRNTPVLAASDGVVSRVGDQRLGGNVIWVRDERRGTSQYYAHLERQLVRRGQRVSAGDTIGLVGNSGNARTTPPHLHFGLYRRGEGPIDPWAFLYDPARTPRRLTADTTGLGSWVRLQSDATIELASLRRSTGTDLSEHTVVRLLGASGRDLRVRLPDGRIGLLRSDLERLDTPIDEAVLAVGDDLLASPEPNAIRRSAPPGTTRLDVVGRFGDFVMIAPREGPYAWVEGTPR